MSSQRPASLFVVLLTLVTFIFYGCGGSTNNTPGPVAFNPPGNGNNSGGSGGFGGGGSTGGGGGDSFAACHTVNTSKPAQITGRVIDAQTQQPISGKVIINVDRTMDAARGKWVNTILASPDGSFESHTLNEVSHETFTLTFLAVDSAGVFYGPKILITTDACPITLGTTIGTIALTPGNSATITAQVTAKTPQGTPASISENPEAVYENANGTLWAIPWSTFIPERQSLDPGPSCPANTACTQITTKVAASPALWAFYNGSSTQFQAVGSQAEYALTILSEPGSQSTLSGQCTPGSLSQSSTPVSAGGTTTFGPFNFTGCK